ncbi:MAG: dihydropteroate synthase [Thermoprotei archaeon]
MRRLARLGKLQVGENQPVRIMGVINVSPESFYKGSVRTKIDDIVETAISMSRNGADVIDVGGMSTAPYLSTWIDEDEEKRRIVEAIKAIRDNIKITISIDTQRSRVAEKAIEAGADVINDVSGLKHDPEMIRIAKEYDVSLILVAHERQPRLGTPIQRVISALKESLDLTRKLNIDENKIVVDPGIGFFRYPEIPWYEWDINVIANINQLAELGKPICIGVSRKSFIGKILSIERPEDRLIGSVAAVSIVVLKGVNMVRTHDVPETIQAVRLSEAIRKAETGGYVEYN